MGLGGLEPPTSRLSGGRSNRLSYRPGELAVPASREMPAPIDGRSRFVSFSLLTVPEYEKEKARNTPVSKN